MTATAKKLQTEIVSDVTDEFGYGAVKMRLAAPIDARLISTKTVGGRAISYVNITDLKDVLDNRVPVWEAHVTDTKQIGENLCVVVRLSIHTTEGIFSQDGTGLEMLTINGYGDPFSNAYAQAFRRACEGFGLGRDLWRKHHAPAAGTSGGGNVSPAAARGKRKPATGKADSTHEPATSAQLVLLNRKLAENNIEAVDLLADEFADVTEVSQLSKWAASYLLDLLMTGN